MIADEWRELCEAIRDTAEGYAATDPANAWRYREEAAAFCAKGTPADDFELKVREHEAELSKRGWTARFRASGGGP